MEPKLVNLHHDDNSSETIENEKENSGIPRKRLLVKMKNHNKQSKKRKKNESSDEDDIIFEELSIKKVCLGPEEASSRVLGESQTNSSSPSSQPEPTVVRNVKKTPESRNPITNFFSRIGAKKKVPLNGDSEAGSTSSVVNRSEAASLNSPHPTIIDLEDTEVVQVSSEELQDDKQEAEEKKDDIDEETRKEFNNAFFKLMNSRKSKESLTVEKSDKLGDSSSKKEVNSKRPADEKLKNMLDVLNSVDSEDSSDEEVREIFASSNRQRRKSRQQKPPAKGEREENVDGIDENIFYVRCKETTGKIHLDKFESGGFGKCISYKDEWYTPNEFEKVSGSRAKKYKVSLYVNDKPIYKLLEARQIRTVSRNDSRTPSKNESRSRHCSGRSTPGAEPRRGRVSPLEVIADVVDEEEEDDRVPEPLPKPKLESKPAAVITESPAEVETPGRRSGRIARNTQAMIEKKKMILEQEEALDKAEKKIEAERKARNDARKKQLQDLERANSSASESSSEVAIVDEKPSKRPKSGKKSSSDSESCNTECVIIDEKPSAEPKSGKKPLASIFTKKSVKVQSPEEEAAKRAFLMSSAPEAVRCQVSQAESAEDSQLPLWPGPDTCPSHVTSEADCPRQSRAGHWSYDLSHQEVRVKPLDAGALRISSEDDEIISERCFDPLSEAEVFSLIQSKSGRVKKMFNSLMERKLEAETFEREAREKNISAAENEEKRIRGNRRRSRRSMDLKKGKESLYSTVSDSGLSWASKYQPRCGSDVLGNEEVIRDIKDWLTGWTKASVKSASVTGSESEVSNDYTTDTDFWDEDEDLSNSICNIALLEGPPGSGKTATVFALAAEMGFNVLEENASSNRSGKRVLSKLSEATQSQQVRRDTGSQAHKSIFQAKEKKDDESSDRKKLMKTALILLEDIDLVFDDLDEGLYSAVNTLSQQSKRPIIMTTSDPTWFGDGVGSANERMFKFNPKLFHLKTSSKVQLAQYLQTVALVEGYNVSENSIHESFLSQRDIRKSLQDLQFYCRSGLELEKRLEGEAETSESEDSSVQIDRWFSSASQKKSKKTVKPKVSSLLQTAKSEENLSHEAWWTGLPGAHVDISPGHHDVEELSDEVVSDHRPAQDSGERLRRYQGLSRLSSHLDTLGCFTPEEEDTAWHILQPVTEGLSQSLPSYRDDTRCNSVMRESYHQTFFKNSLTCQENGDKLSDNWVKRKDIDKQEVWDSQHKAYYSDLVDIFLTDRVGRLDLQTGIRMLAKGQEVKRAEEQKREGKRRNRFIHYFDQSGCVLEDEVLTVLCKSFSK